jgi:hypothetical protein
LVDVKAVDVWYIGASISVVREHVIRMVPELIILVIRHGAASTSAVGGFLRMNAHGEWDEKGSGAEH